MGPGVGMGTLASHWETPAMSESPIATYVHKSLDIHRNFGPEATLYLVFSLNLLTQFCDIIIGQIDGAAVRVYTRMIQYEL